MTVEIEIPLTEVPLAVNGVDFLSELSGLPKSRIKDAMTKGAAWIEQRGKQHRLRRAKRILRPGDKVALYYAEKILDLNPQVPELLDDQKDFSIWIKPAGLMSGGSRYGDHCAINRIVEKKLDRPTFLVHRLDRFAWGLIVLAHSKKAAASLSKQFQDRTVDKVYHAIVEGELTEPRHLDATIGDKAASSHVTPVMSGNGRSLLEVKIETGRKHQIRLHLSGAGYPIVGDRQYGAEDPAGLQLAAVELAFTHPVTETEVRYRLPEESRPTL